MLAAVQPSFFCIERIGRGFENRNISFLRTPNIWLLTSFDASLAKNATSGAILSAVIVFIRSMRCASASLVAGIVAISRLHAKGAMQFDRTPARAISSAIDCDSPTMSSFAAE